MLAPVAERLNSLCADVNWLGGGKLLNNALIGIWQRQPEDVSWRWLESTSRSELQALSGPRPAMESVGKVGERMLVTWAIKTVTKRPTTSMPLAFQILDFEACALAAIALELDRIPALVCEWSTDSVLAWAETRNATKVRMLAKLTFPDGRKPSASSAPPRYPREKHQSWTSAPGTCLRRRHVTCEIFIIAYWKRRSKNLAASSLAQVEEKLH